MNQITLGLVIFVAIVCMYLVVQVAKLRRKIYAVPEDGNVFATLAELDLDLAQVEDTVAQIAPRLEILESLLPEAIRHTGVVAYDAFDNIAGNQSRSIALLNDRGNGLVISLLVGRTETLFFTKQVRNSQGVEPLSPEEADAVTEAMDG